MLRSDVVAANVGRRAFTARFDRIDIEFRAGASNEIASRLRNMKLERPGLICSASVARAHSRLLTAAPWDAYFTDPRVHVPPETVAAARKSLGDVRSLVAIGGGSAIGLGKLLAVGLELPLVAVPTTYSGSEMTALYGSLEDGRKVVRHDLRALPRAVVYDPELTVGLPERAAWGSVINCLAHGIDTAWCVQASPLAKATAVASAEAVAAAIESFARADGASGRAALLEAGWLGGVALASGQLGLHHALCHAIGGVTRASHGDIHAVVLPAVMRFNAAFEDTTAPIVAPLAVARHAPEDAPPHDVLAALRDDWGLPGSLRELGLNEPDQLRSVADDVAAHDSTRRNPRAVGADLLFDLLLEIV
jgi:maleylacetate reductase